MAHLRRTRRSSGILLHISSLPGPYGIGDLGPGAFAWVDSLVRAKQPWWQVLPLGPTGDGGCPYQSFSAFAGNPNLISPESLVEDGLLSKTDASAGDFPPATVDYHRVHAFKNRLLRRAWRNFRAESAGKLAAPYAQFHHENSDWVNDFALFIALKEAHHGKAWTDWSPELRSRDSDAIRAARQTLRDEIDFHCFVQFLFFGQLEALRGYARDHGVRPIGDLPMFVSANSADVWANPDEFLLDRHGRPKFVAGVPPDYFSKTGQRWGNPLYNWPVMRRNHFHWWNARVRAALRQADLVRIDHFRGLEAYWAIPASRPTAQVGRWTRAPGADLLRALRRHLGCLPFIAEDLGLITPAVAKLRDDFNLPGMRVVQFGFGSDGNDPFLPHNYPRNCVAYTGTHDNDTAAGWHASLDQRKRHRVAMYTGRDGADIAWDLIRLAWSSVADLAVVPAQDLLGLGSEARMNHPGRAGGNWKWRLDRPLGEKVVDRLGELTELCGRSPR